MRGLDTRQEGMFSYVSPESRIPKDHPLRPIREMVDDALKELSADFDALYSHTGQPSIAPEKLIRALLLQVFYSIRSERLLMEQLEYNLLFRWFVGLNTDDPVWVPTVFTHNRDRLLEGEIVTKLFGQVLAQAEEKGLTSDEHFSGQSEPANLGDRERFPVHGYGMPFDAAIVLQHAKQWITPGEVLVHHSGAVDLQRAGVLAQHHETRRMIDLGIDEDDGADRGVANRAPRLQIGEGAELRPDVGGGIEQHPVLAVPDRDRRLGAGLCRDRALAQAGAVAAVAVPLREAAARGGAEYVYAHRGRESSWSGPRS